MHIVEKRNKIKLLGSNIKPFIRKGLIFTVFAFYFV